ncbi:MAG: hypothetical protein HY289_05125 [Planctomycetes bacterium]|nr:hypothetical protein [Planctomycetota bacterium]
MNANDIATKIQAWADKYHARIDRDLLSAWSDLELRLRDLVDTMSLRELTLGPRADFHVQRLGPVIATWATGHIVPILDAAEVELRAICESIRNLHGVSQEVPGEWSGTLSFSDVWGPGAAAAGATVGVVAVILGISKATAWLIFTVIVVNWYLVIAGVVVGAALIALGGYGTFGLKAKLRDRFRDKLVPMIKEAILGDTFELNGKKVPSVRCQLKDVIERGKVEAIRMLGTGIS